jgi:hypothetical protein
MPDNFISQWDKKEITYNYACDVTVSVYPHWASLRNMPGRCGYTLRVTSQASYSPEYITPAQKNIMTYN